MPCFIDFDLQKITPGPQKSWNSFEKTIVFEELAFSARVACWSRFWTLLAPFWSLLAAKMAETCLGISLGAVQEYFFRPRERPKSRPRAPHKRLEVPPWPTKPFKSSKRPPRGPKRPPRGLQGPNGPCWHHFGAILEPSRSDFATTYVTFPR